MGKRNWEGTTSLTDVVLRWPPKRQFHYVWYGVLEWTPRITYLEKQQPRSQAESAVGTESAGAPG